MGILINLKNYDKGIYLIKKYFFYLLFFLILLVGFLIRIWDLDKNPAGFFCDEASVGYNAYTILTQGKDEYGITFPLFFKAFGEYKNPLDIYATTIPILIFGLNEFSVRLTSVFFSILTGVTFFLIGKELKSKQLGLMFMFVYFIVPWSVHMSRINLEGKNILLFLYILSGYLLLLYEKKKSNIFIIIFSLILGLANYSYFPARIITPLLFFSLIFYFFVFKKKNRKENIKSRLCLFLSVIIYLLVSIPLYLHVFYGEGMNRWKQVSLFNNKEINPFKKISQSYLLHYSPDFLFLKGDIDMKGQFITRHSIRGVGEFYFWQSIFIFVGVFFILRNIKKPINLYFFLLLFLYPLPSSLTNSLSPQATRSVVGILPIVFATGIGIHKIFSYLNKKNKISGAFFIIILIIIIIFSLFDFIKLYSIYPLYSSNYWGWQFGPREIISYFKSQSKNYDELYLTGFFNGPEIFLKFYDKEHICKNCFIGGIERYDKNKKQLFALRTEEIEKLELKYRVKKVINYPNGRKAFIIIEPFFE